MAYNKYLFSRYRKFWLGIFARLVLLTLTCMGLVGAVLVEKDWKSPIVVISAVGLLSSAILLIRYMAALVTYIEQTNQHMVSLLYALKEGNFMNTSPILHKNPNFDKMNRALQEVMRQFHTISFERESYLKLLQTLNENVQVGLLLTDDEQVIQMINEPAMKIIGLAKGATLDHLSRHKPDLHACIIKLEVNQSKVISGQRDNEKNQYAIKKQRIKIDEKWNDIFIFQNITLELDNKEVQSWQELTNVLMHEMMNSVTPIFSLVTSVHRILSQPQNRMQDGSIDLKPDQSQLVQDSLLTVERRSANLINFVQAYKEFATVPQVSLSETNLVELMRNCIEHFQLESPACKIDFTSNIAEHKAIRLVDEVLLERVFQNVLKNAQEALERFPQGEIGVKMEEVDEKLLITISDNGVGMDQETLDKIFIPFFTTKPSGTGVGLSLSKQIIQMHQGRIFAQSVRGKGTTVIIEFH